MGQYIPFYLERKRDLFSVLNQTLVLSEHFMQLGNFKLKDKRAVSKSSFVDNSSISLLVQLGKYEEATRAAKWTVLELEIEENSTISRHL